MRRIGFLATESYYVDHLASIWLALPKKWRGPFFVSPKSAYTAKRYGINNLIKVSGPRLHIANEMKSKHNGPVMTASWSNWRIVEKAGLPAPTIPHGQGGPGASSANSKWMSKADKIDLMLVPAEYGKGSLDGVNTVIIHGQPKLDRWYGYKPEPSNRPVLAISFRWRDSHSAALHYKPYLKEIRRRANKAGIHLLGHGHPLKFDSDFVKLWNDHRIESTGLFENVLERAHVYAADCSSSSFEFVGLDRPVVFLDDPKYVEYTTAPRFTLGPLSGIVNLDPLNLIEDTLKAYEDPADIAESRRNVANLLFGEWKGEASQNAAEALIDFYG